MNLTLINPQVCGSALRVARTFNGWTLKELAERTGVTHAYIHHLEAGTRVPKGLFLSVLAEQLGFQEDFFRRPLKDEFRDEQCHFRKRKTTAVSVKTRVLAQGTLFGMLLQFLDESVQLPQVSLPHEPFGDRDMSERAAAKARLWWGLGLDTPIVSMQRVLEHGGVVVTRLEGSTEALDAIKIDAFSRWGNRPVVVLNSDKGSTSRSRWDMAHELGHLVLHAGLEAGNPEFEDHTDWFAGEFLLPRVGFLRDFHHQTQVDWEHIFTLKQRWMVSAKAILRRAHELGRIGPTEYQRALKVYSARGWNRGEPDEPPTEAPEVVPEALLILEQTRGQTPLDVARALGWSEQTFEVVTGIAAKPLTEVKSEPAKAKVFPLRRLQGTATESS